MNSNVPKTGPFGLKAMHAMGYCGVMASALDVPISVPTLFFAAIRILDPEDAIITKAQRSTALDITAWYLRHNAAKEFEAFNPFVLRLIDRVFRGELELIKPIDLLEAAARESAVEIEQGLRAADRSLDDVMDRIRRLPPDRLSDEPPRSEESAEPRNYAVVIEGPGFRDDSNRFHRLDEAQAAQNIFLGIAREKRIPDDPFVARLGFPARLSEATSVSIHEL